MLAADDGDRHAAAGLQAAVARGRRSSSARSTSAASAWSPRSSAGKAATRRSRSTRRSTRARSRPRASRRRTSPTSRRRSTRAAAAARCSACTPAARSPTRRSRSSSRCSARSAATPATATSDGHAIFDLGEEEYTQGRPHPMVDLEVRLGMLERAAERDGVGCVLLDVVIGHGSHADPAGGLAAALARAGHAHPGDRPRLRHRRRPAGRRPPGGDAARGGRDRRAHQRGRGAAGRDGRSHEDRDAHLLGQAARRGRARARGLRGARAARPRGRADGARAAGRGAVPRDAACRCGSSATRRSTRPFDAPHRGACSRPTPRACARCWRRPLRHRPRPGLPVGQRRARAARRGRDRPRDPHRAPRRRLHLAVAGRVPGPLDRRPRPRAVRLARRGSTRLRDEFGVDAGLVPNGVDTHRFRPPRDAAERARRPPRAPASTTAWSS